MTVSSKYAYHYVPVKYFLSSYRALSDGRGGISELEQRLDKSNLFLSEWKVIWIGTCTILRSAIDLFKIDAKSCLAPRIREEISAEWKAIKEQKEEHAIFWDFLKQERDNVIHEYQWRSYEAWIKPDGTFRAPRLSLLMIDDDGARPILLMNNGPYQGRNSLELLIEAADWVEARIFGAIRRAGFDPEEKRGLVHFDLPPKLKNSLISNSISGEDSKY